MKTFLAFLFLASVVAASGQSITGPTSTTAYGGNGGMAANLINNTSGNLYVTLVNVSSSVTVWNAVSSGPYTGYGSGGVPSPNVVQFLLTAGQSTAVYSQSLSPGWYLISGTGSFNYAVSTTSYPSGANATNSFSYTLANNVKQYYSISASSPIVNTNFVLTIRNVLGVPATATWTYNGAVVKTETLAPGQFDSWTTPSVEVSPSPSSATWGEQITPVGSSIGFNGDGSPNFSSGSTGGGLSASGSISGGGLTTTGTSGSGVSGGGGSTIDSGGVTVSSGTNSSITIGTNVISWSPPSGTASESTEEAAATLAHSDSLNLLQGLSVINSTLATASFQITNELGQIITYMTTGNESLVAIATNIAAIKNQTNQASVVLSNLVLTVSNSPLSLTNYATETTLKGGSNLLNDIVSTNGALLSLISGFESNASSYAVSSDGSNYDAALATANSRLSGVVSQWHANQSQITGPGYSEGQDVPDDMTLTVGSFGFIDFNPLHNSGVASIFSMAKKFIAWLFVFAYLGKVITDTLQTVRWLADGKTRTVAPLETEALGFGGNIAGFGLSLVGSVVVMVVWAVVLGIVLTWTISGFDVFGTFNTNPLTGGPKGSVGLAESVFPFGLFFALSSSYLIWRMTYGLALLLGLAVIRMMFGG